MNGIRLLVQAMETFSTEPDVIRNMCQSLVVLSAYQNKSVPEAYLPEVHQTFMSLDVSRSVLAVMESSMSNAVVVQSTAAALSRMAVMSDMAKSIAEQGMHIIAEAIVTHKEDGEVILNLLHVVKFICFVEENITLFIQADGITRLTDLFMVFDDNVFVIQEAVRTLSTVATANSEFADVMKNVEGADEILRMAMEKNVEPPKIEDEDDPIYHPFFSGDDT